MTEKKLADVKNSNGISLQSYTETLVQEADALGATIFVCISLPQHGGIHTMTNVAGGPAVVARLMKDMAHEITKKPQATENLNRLREEGKEN